LDALAHLAHRLEAAGFPPLDDPSSSFRFPAGKPSRGGGLAPILPSGQSLGSGFIGDSASLVSGDSGLVDDDHAALLAADTLGTLASTGLPPQRFEGGVAFGRRFLGFTFNAKYFPQLFGNAFPSGSTARSITAR
jgi:hypothetical protein